MQRSSCNNTSESEICQKNKSVNLRGQIQALRKEYIRRQNDGHKQASAFSERIDQRNKEIRVRQSEVDSQEIIIKKLLELKNLVAEGKNIKEVEDERDV